MTKIITIPAALRTGSPVALCLGCAAACGEIYILRQRGLTHMGLCAGCHKRRYIAAYILTRRGPGREGVSKAP